MNIGPRRGKSQATRFAGRGRFMGQDPQAPVSWWRPRLLCPGEGPHSSPLDGFGEVGIPGGTTG
jgi:hypothetical protein